MDIRDAEQSLRISAGAKCCINVSTAALIIEGRHRLINQYGNMPRPRIWRFIYRRAASRRHGHSPHPHITPLPQPRPILPRPSLDKTAFGVAVATTHGEWMFLREQ